jgi:hypothetical protein
MRARIKDRLGMGLALALLMGLTRFTHFGHSIQPADASWAVFLLGGALLHGMGAFAAFCAMVGAIDLSAFALGVSSACMSPAYVFLLPAYAALWWVGGWAGAGAGARSQMLRVAVAAVLGASVAFAITNASFFAFAEPLAGMPLYTFATRVAPYFPSYVVTTLAYALAGYGLALGVRAARRSGSTPQHNAA